MKLYLFEDIPFASGDTYHRGGYAAIAAEDLYSARLLYHNWLAGYKHRNRDSLTAHPSSTDLEESMKIKPRERFELASEHTQRYIKVMPVGCC